MSAGGRGRRRRHAGSGRAGRGRARGATALLVIGTVSLHALLVCVWIWWAFGTQRGFTELSVELLEDPAVRSVVTRQIVEELESHGVATSAARGAAPVLAPAVASVVRTKAFAGLVYAGTHELFATLVRGEPSGLRVRVDDVAQMVKDSLRDVDPALAAAIPDGAIEIDVGLPERSRLETLTRTASAARWFLWPLIASTIGCFTTAVVVAADRRRALLRVGLLLLGSAVTWFVLLVGAVALVSRAVEGAIDRAAVRAVVRSITHVPRLSTRSLLDAGVLLTLAAVAAGPTRLRTAGREGAAWLRGRWARPRSRTALLAVAAFAAVVAVTDPNGIRRFLVRPTAMGLAFAALVALLDVLTTRVRPARPDRATRRPAVRHTLVAGTALVTGSLVLPGLGGLAVYRSIDARRTTAPDPQGGCNGHLELCDRRLDQVVLAGTHNAMAASAEKGWYFTRQTGGISAQLARGVRAFLVDAHYGTAIGGIVRTDFGSDADEQASDAELTVAQRGVLRDRKTVLARLLEITGYVRNPAATHDVFLCHLYCELGATRAVEAFRAIDGFLAENPNEVVVLIVEDHVRPADVEAELRRSGLSARAFAPRADAPLPTLRDMVTSRRNLLVMAEREGGTAPWYPAAYEDLLQDTPYRFATVDDFTCALGRGRAGNPLLLVNHWLSVDPASQQAAATANARDVLLARAARCRAERARLPTIVAVDFYASGDLFSAVDELNGV